MKTFSQFFAERLNETEHTVPVTRFFTHEPNTRVKKAIPTILDKLKDGKLHPVQQDCTLRNLIPCQEVVNLKKVMKKLDKGDDKDHPIVVMRDGSDKYIVDGHHRACALMLADSNARVPCTVVDVADVARFL